MNRGSGRLRIGTSAVLLVALVGAVLVAAPSGAGAAVRGFDGKTITVAGFGIASQFAKSETGAQARIKRFNDTNEIKGIKIKYAEFADDKQDPTTALSEARRLVTQVGVFAIVGDASQNNPGDYFKQQKVPYYGYAFDNSYCSPKPDQSIYGFGFNGCLVPQDPSVMPDNGKNPYTYVAEKTGKKHPTLALFSNDSDSGKNAVKFQEISYKGAGFDIVEANNQMPLPPVADYTPYVQKMLTADDGNPPDAIVCLLATDCIPMWDQIKASGYSGSYFSSLYADVLLKPLAGSIATTPFVPLDQNTKGLNRLKKDLDAFEPGSSAKIDTGTMVGYLSTDMFITALKAVAKKGKSNITAENVQKQSMNQTWKIDGVAGPTVYPKATVSSFQSCSAEVLSDGTKWVQEVPYTCSAKQWPVK